MDISPEIKKAFEGLLGQQSFVNHIGEYTRSALQTIYNVPQSEQIDCPPTYILLLNHLISTSQPLDLIASALPSGNRTAFTSICKQFLNDDNEAVVKIDNTFHKNLTDIEWEMTIENGRQIWMVRLFTAQTDKPFVMKLNYEQLSVLTFQVSQIVSHLSHMGQGK